MKDFARIFVPVSLIIIVLWFAWWGYANYNFADQTARGQLGDLFGGVNAIFSGLALAGVVTAVILQSRELELQRKEMEKSREQLVLTRDEMSLQREQLALQREELQLSREEFKRMAAANEESAKAHTKQLKLQAFGSTIIGFSSMLASANSQALVKATYKGSVGHPDMDKIRHQEDMLQKALEALSSELTM
ncbi:hypothetical protein [Prosthecobacter sp.]|uniref:hypothetical protein n=1 Tax=Prosthecobacter sp. TaxID=1965333 RepID=UPI00378395D2